MDAAFPVEGLIQEFGQLLDARDYEGAEELMVAALATPSQFEALLHYQLGRLYRRWNKMTSALNHLTRAAELAQAGGERIFLIQIMDEYRAAKDAQTRQTP